MAKLGSFARALSAAPVTLMSPITVTWSAVLSAVLQLLGVDQDTLGVFLLAVLRTFFSLLNLLMVVLFDLS